MAGVGKSFHFLLVLSVVFLLLSVSVRCNDVEELNQDKEIRVYNLTFKSLIASFGGPHPDNGAEFRVTVASPYRNACEPIDPPPKSDSRVSAAQLWIVLIRRKDCKFVEKVRNAQAAGYHAALIYSNVGSNDLILMGGFPGDDGNGTFIPAFFIGHDDGVNLTNKYFQAREKGQTLVLSMKANEDDKQLADVYKRLLFYSLIPLLSALIGPVLLLFLVLFIVKIVQFVTQKCSIHRQKKRLADLSLLSISLATIPIVKFKSGDPYETCAICTEDYAEGDELRLLYCSHGFHSKCIDHWLAHHRRICPLCNQRVESQPTSVV